MNTDLFNLLIPVRNVTIEVKELTENDLLVSLAKQLAIAEATDAYPIRCSKIFSPTWYNLIIKYKEHLKANGYDLHFYSTLDILNAGNPVINSIIAIRPKTAGN